MRSERRDSNCYGIVRVSESVDAQSNLIYPKVVGKSVGLPGLLVLMAVVAGGEAFGILGMLFSVPVCAVLYSLYLDFLKKACPS